MAASPKIPFGPRLQAWIHNFEVGAGSKFIKWGALAMAALALLVGYNWRAYRNMSTPEAMDAAQVGRNLAEGKGFTTLFVRPLSIYLLTNRAGGIYTSASTPGDVAQLRAMHPDLANPPVYPLILAGLMKVLPFNYAIPNLGNEAAATKKYFWNKDGMFYWYPPDFLIAMFNELLLIGVVVMTFKLAMRLFDIWVAWLSALMVIGSELLWHFSVSGLPTILLLLLFLLVCWCLVALESAVRESKGGASMPLVLSILAGLIVGIGGLTRYSFGWLILPTMLFIGLFSGSRRSVNILAALAIFVAVLAPWLIRNYKISGAPFGTATYAIIENTPSFPEHQLQRSLQPMLLRVRVTALWRKLLYNGRIIFTSDLPKLGESWVSAFFLVGLLLAFKNPAISRFRYFVVSCIALLVVVQALGRTQLSEESPAINSENLLVVMTPLVIMFGVSLFFVLLEQMELSFIQLRYAIIGVFGALTCAPMIMVFVLPRVSPITNPPYYPPLIQLSANWMSEKELMMSDVPWAVAWYGHRQCLWLTLDARRQFLAIHDYIKPIRALYLTPRTTDCHLLTGEDTWVTLALTLWNNEVPPGFPLTVSPVAYPRPNHQFLTDYERWKRKTEPKSP